MADYRIFVLNKLQRIAAPAIIVSCETDEEAIQNAHAYVNGTGVQVWQGVRIVAELSPNELPPQTTETHEPPAQPNN